MWRELDLLLYSWMAPGTATTALMPVAIWLAQWSSLLLLCVAVHTVLRGTQRVNRALICLASVLVAQVLAHALAQHWNTPRPFMLGLSTNHLAHGMRGGLPSAHASVMFALGTALWLTGIRSGLVAALAAVSILLTAWARVYSGAHFPLDILAGAVLGSAVAWLCARFSWLCHRSFVAPSRTVATMALTSTGDKA